MAIEDAQADITEITGWPDGSGPWSARLHWQTVRGRPECVGLEVWLGAQVGGSPMEGHAPAAITATQLRALRPDSLIREARKRLATGKREALEVGLRYIATENRKANRGQVAESPFRPSGGARVRSRSPHTARLEGQLDELSSPRPWPKDAKPRGRRRDNTHGPEHWAKVAAVYVEALRDGFNPTAEVSEQCAGSYSQAASWISRSRQKGYLTPTEPGRPGGELTDLAKKVLTEEAKNR